MQKGMIVLGSPTPPAPPPHHGIILGTDIFTGEVVRRQLPALTHTLVAGTTGFGKSVFLHQLISQLVRRADVERLYLIDFKCGVEFCHYEGRGDHVHIIWEFPDLIRVVGELFELMQRRLLELRERRQRNWAGSRIVVVIDEYSEIQLAPAEKAVRMRLLDDLNRLAARSRGAGIVIVAATQKPTTDAMDSSFSANLPTRVCFRVASNLVASMVLGTIEDLRRDAGLEPVMLRRGWCIMRDSVAGELRYLQPHVAPEAED